MTTTDTTEAAAGTTPVAASFFIKVRQVNGSAEVFAAARYRYRQADVLLLDVLEPGAAAWVEYRLDRGVTAFVMSASTGDTVEQLHGRRRGDGGQR